MVRARLLQLVTLCLSAIFPRDDGGKRKRRVHYIDMSLLQIINFYYDIDDKISLCSLLTLDLVSTIPTILIRDFNLHSHSWLPPGISPSPWLSDFETWATSQAFDLITSTRDITCCCQTEEYPSTLDLTWYNLAAAVSTPLTLPTIDWVATLGSNHASIHTSWIPKDVATLQYVQPLCSYSLDMEETKQSWHVAIHAHLLMPTPLTTGATIKSFALDLQVAVYNVCEAHLKHKMAPGACSKTWWTKESTMAAKVFCDTATAGADSDTQMSLCQTLEWVTRKAKHNWANKAVAQGNV